MACQSTTRAGIRRAAASSSAVGDAVSHTACGTLSQLGSNPRGTRLRVRLAQQRLITHTLRGVSSSRPGRRTAARLLAHGRTSGTQRSYADKWAKFVHFCTTVQREAGFRPLCPLPAKPATVVCYIAWLSDQGIKEKSLNPYKSAINQAHSDMGLRKPAEGDQLRLLRKGYAALEGQGVDPVARVPVPAAAIDEILDLGLRTDEMPVSVPVQLWCLRSHSSIGVTRDTSC